MGTSQPEAFAEVLGSTLSAILCAGGSPKWQSGLPFISNIYLLAILAELRCVYTEKQSQVYHEVQPDQPRTERARAFLLRGLTPVGASCRDSVSVPVAWGEARFLGRVGGEVLTPRGRCGKPRQPRAPPT